MQSITRFITKQLKLAVNEKKSKVAPVGDCSFLGFTFVRGKIRWSDKSFTEFKRRLKCQRAPLKKHQLFAAGFCLSQGRKG